MRKKLHFKIGSYNIEILKNSSLLFPLLVSVYSIKKETV
ncbi:MAG: hypothetical protein JETT_1775 [Candidatus Jettenia ecosi]|uniref:Uncharacterized protein n=1 Tax=Candidatus Jettenia ecosi TaxID=2494326 RepID=A0A533QB92_9BACT|nr:MAG: hypothetical protein JETT_1775 [Candidatus Jettenia ecosi]